MKLIKLLLISEILSDDDPIIKHRLEKYNRKNRWKKALKDSFWWSIISFIGAIIFLILMLSGKI